MFQSHIIQILPILIALSLADEINPSINVDKNSIVASNKENKIAEPEGTKCVSGNGVNCINYIKAKKYESIIDNDDSEEVNKEGKIPTDDDTIDVSAYNETDEGSSLSRYYKNEDDEDEVLVDVVNGKGDGTRLNGLLELKEIVDKSKKQIKIPVYGTLHDYAYYFIEVYVGTKPIPQWVVLDTGSSLFAITCGHCVQCGMHENPNYKPDESTTSSKCSATSKCNLKDCQECKFIQNYSEGSFISGEYYNDVIAFNKKSKSHKYTNVGCILYENNLIYNQLANGIFGMSPKEGSIVSQLYRHNNMQNVFSLCLSDEGGELIFGGVNREIFNSQSSGGMAWTRLYADNNYYIKIVKANFLDENIELAETKFSIDSGTTNTVVPNTLYESIVKGVMSICTRDNDIETQDIDVDVKILQKDPDNIADLIIDREDTLTKCEIINNEICSTNIDNFPPLYLTLDGGDILAINSDTYFFKRNSWWCLGIERSKDGENIFGADFFRNKQLVFNDDKLGFIPSDCPSHIVTT